MTKLSQKPRFVYDYARNAKSLNDLRNLKRLLEACKKADDGRVFIDDFARLIKIADMLHRVSLLEELREFGAWIYSIKHNKLLAEFSGGMLNAMVRNPEHSKHLARQLRHQDTIAARHSSIKTRSRNAVLLARSLADLRDELNAAQGHAKLQGISDEANMRGMKSSRGKNWTPQNVSRALKLLEESDNNEFK